MHLVPSSSVHTIMPTVRCGTTQSLVELKSLVLLPRSMFFHKRDHLTQRKSGKTVLEWPVSTRLRAHSQLMLPARRSSTPDTLFSNSQATPWQLILTTPLSHLMTASRTPTKLPLTVRLPEKLTSSSPCSSQSLLFQRDHAHQPDQLPSSDQTLI